MDHDMTRTVSFFIKLNTSAIDRDAPLDIWQGILDLDSDADWMDVYQAVARGYLVAGDHSDYILASGEDISNDDD